MRSRQQVAEDGADSREQVIRTDLDVPDQHLDEIFVTHNLLGRPAEDGRVAALLQRPTRVRRFVAETSAGLERECHPRYRCSDELHRFQGRLTVDANPIEQLAGAQIVKGGTVAGDHGRVCAGKVTDHVQPADRPAGGEDNRNACLLSRSDGRRIEFAHRAVGGEKRTVEIRHDESRKGLANGHDRWSCTRGGIAGSSSLPTIRSSPASVALRLSPCRMETATRLKASQDRARVNPTRSVSPTPMGIRTLVSRSRTAASWIEAAGYERSRWRSTPQVQPARSSTTRRPESSANRRGRNVPARAAATTAL